jgi:small subunit ribosomal protein S18
MIMEKKRPRRDDDEDKRGFDQDNGGDEEKGARPQRRFQRRRQGMFVPDYIDWKDVDFLRRFVPERGKILPRRISMITAKEQRRVQRAIKRARAMALLPYVAD